ncbi:MAG: hypothetical protein QOF78_1686 [Phycisphaerales bacterium]|nr:hypothetical protein [Phycisphaerales bacterium]
MSKWFAVIALGASMAVVSGCNCNKEGDSTDPKKMSLTSGSACKTECSKDAAPKKLSASAGTDCKSQCPAGAAKTK